MDRRTFNKLTSLAAIGVLSKSRELEAEQIGGVGNAEKQSTFAEGSDSHDWKSGQDSPVHDSDRLYPIGSRSIVLENDHLYLAFDQHTGALVKFANKITGWQWQTEASLGESFTLFVPTPDRSYNPVLGARNTLSSLISRRMETP